MIWDLPIWRAATKLHLEDSMRDRSVAEGPNSNRQFPQYTQELSVMILQMLRAWEQPTQELKLSAPEIYGRASVDSGYRSTLSGNANDVDDPSQYAPIASNQSRYANLVPNQNLSQTSAPPSNHRRQSSMENGQTHQSANEGLADEGHDNHQVFDTYFLDVEHENHGDLDFDPTSVEQENLADFDFGVSVAEQDNIGDFGSSSLHDSGSSRNTVPAP
jgi:hypothetical protein